MSNDYDSTVPEVVQLSAPSPLRSEVIAAFNAMLRRIESLERTVQRLMKEAS